MPLSEGKLTTGLAAGGFLNDKGHALNLALIVEGQAADISIRVCFLALMNLIQDLRGLIAPEHWQLPQCPIPPVIVAWNLAVLSVYIPHLTWKRKQTGLIPCSRSNYNPYKKLPWKRKGAHLVELKARDPTLFEHVVYLLCNRVIRERREIRERLKLLVIDWIPCL